MNKIIISRDPTRIYEDWGMVWVEDDSDEKILLYPKEPSKKIYNGMQQKYLSTKELNNLKDAYNNIKLEQTLINVCDKIFKYHAEINDLLMEMQKGREEYYFIIIKMKKDWFGD